ncbi:MAG: glycosyltransferase [Candidatus Eremiobacteraeota bacterium]|nr:glycosyltransferase [Candidatus Eremiobacteraeota bacterium]
MEENFRDLSDARISELLLQLDEAQRQLIEKERVICVLRRYQNTSLRYWLGYRFLRVILNHPALSRPLRYARRWLPIWDHQCFDLIQHSPRPLHIPAKYRELLGTTATLPTITLVTPSRNQAEFIERTLASVLDQNYPNLEYVVMDGASTDDTVARVNAHAHRLARFISQADSGQAQAINRGFQGNTGEIMGWLNSDDILLPGSLDYVARFFAENPEVDVVYGHRIQIDEQDREIGRWILPEHDASVLPWADYIPQETLFWRRRIWERIGGALCEDLQFALDWDLLLRFQAAGANFVRLPRFLGGFRVHQSQKTSAHLNSIGTLEMSRLRIQYLGRRVSDFEVSRQLAPFRQRSRQLHWRYRLGILGH